MWARDPLLSWFDLKELARLRFGPFQGPNTLLGLFRRRILFQPPKLLACPGFLAEQGESCGPALYLFRMRRIIPKKFGHRLCMFA
jgi:hypothetical protein